MFISFIIHEVRGCVCSSVRIQYQDIWFICSVKNLSFRISSITSTSGLLKLFTISEQATNNSLTIFTVLFLWLSLSVFINSFWLKCLEKVYYFIKVIDIHFFDGDFFFWRKRCSMSEVCSFKIYIHSNHTFIMGFYVSIIIYPSKKYVYSTNFYIIVGWSLLRLPSKWRIWLICLF